MNHLRILTTLVVLSMAALPAIDAQTPATGGPPTLQPGDILRIQIWRETDLSGEFTINETGSVVLPLLGPQLVTTVPIAELRNHLISQYREELRNPSISITPLRRVYVLGEVNNPGLQKVDPTISLAGVIAIAGGATSTGNVRRIRIIRGGQVVQERVRSETMLDQVGIRSGDQVIVMSRPWLERNTTVVVSMLLSATSIAVSLLR